MNRRRFLRQTAKVAAGIVAANAVSIALDAIPVSAARMIPVAEPSPIYEWTGESWEVVDFQIRDVAFFDFALADQQITELFHQTCNAR